MGNNNNNRAARGEMAYIYAQRREGRKEGIFGHERIETRVPVPIYTGRDPK
jgi:hypothetical protein